MARYAFRDGEVAARRLALVAAAFEPSSRAFLGRAGGGPHRLAVDLGCGPGHTTLLLAGVLRPRRTLGLDASAGFVELARASAPPGGTVAFACHDVTTTPFPEAPAGLLYCRFLLTHLGDPGAALGRWATQLGPGGRLLADEVDHIRTDHPLLRAYLDAVAALLAARGQRLEVGPLLHELPDPPGLRRLESRVAPRSPPARLVGEMFGLNLSVWRHDPLARQVAGAQALDRLAEGLAVLARGGEPATITWGLRQLVYERA